MGKPHRFRRLTDVAGTIARSTSIADAARRLGVDPSTVHRWIKVNKVVRPQRERHVAPAPTTPAVQDIGAAEWRRQVLDAYDCTASELALVDLAARALAIAQDGTVKPETRLAASARFAALLRQLDLEEPTDGEVEETPATDARGHVRAWPRPVG